MNPPAFFKASSLIGYIDIAKIKMTCHLRSVDIVHYIRVPNTFPESNSTTNATTMTNFNSDEIHYCAFNVVSLHLLIAIYNTYDKSLNIHNRINDVLVFDGMCGATKFFSMIFPYTIVLQMDYQFYFRKCEISKLEYSNDNCMENIF